MIDNFPNHFPVMGTGIIIRGDQVNPDSTGWELGIRNPTMGTIQGVCTRGRELATRVLVTVGVTVVTALPTSHARTGTQ